MSIYRCHLLCSLYLRLQRFYLVFKSTYVRPIRWSVAFDQPQGREPRRAQRWLSPASSLTWLGLFLLLHELNQAEVCCFEHFDLVHLLNCLHFTLILLFWHFVYPARICSLQFLFRRLVFLASAQPGRLLPRLRIEFFRRCKLYNLLTRTHDSIHISRGTTI